MRTDKRAGVGAGYMPTVSMSTRERSMAMRCGDSLMIFDHVRECRTGFLLNFDTVSEGTTGRSML